MRLSISKTELEKCNEILKNELNKIKTELLQQKQNIEISSIDAIKKANELNTRLISLEKEHEYSVKSKESLIQDLTKKLEQISLEKQSIEVDYKTLKEKLNIELENKETLKKLELDKLNMRYQNTIKKLENSLEEKNKEIDQIMLENQDLKNKINVFF